MRILAAGVWAAAFLAGLYGVYLRLFSGHELMGYSSYVPWGLGVALYIFFIGLSAGSFLLSSLVYVFGLQRLERVGKLALFTALTTLVAALLTIWFDIGHMERFWEIYLTPSWTSPMTWMVWLYSAYILLVSVEFWFAIRADLVEWSRRPGLQGWLASLLTLGRRSISPGSLKRDRLMLTVLGSLGIPLAIAFHGGVGALFAVVGARPFWNTSLFPLAFIVGALASGGALLAFIAAFFWPDRGTGEHRDLVRLLGRMTLGLLLVYLLFEWAEFSIPLYAGIPQHATPFLTALFGPYWWVFWGLHLAAGALLPVGLLVWRPSSPRWVGIASGLVAVAFLGVRLNIVIPGLVLPQLEGLESAYIDPRLDYQYFPTLAEWLLNLFPAVLAVGFFYLGYRYLPLITPTHKEVLGHG